MKIFLDVGCHLGETLDEVIKDYHTFDKIVAFEPSTTCFRVIEQKYKNVILCNFGLSNRTGQCILYDTGGMGASIFPDKNDLESNFNEPINIVNASGWISKNTSVDDTIYLKLNCEGSECDIIEDLIRTGVYDRISHIMIDFDVRKIPSQSHRQNQILNLLSGKKNYHVCENVMIGATHQDKIRNWLSVCTRS
jgi:FkbM family methyltransferase